MTDPLTPDPDGWLRVTPAAKLRVSCHGTPLSLTYDEMTDQLFFDDPDLALRPIEFRLDAAPEDTADQQDTTTLAAVLTDVYSPREHTGERAWIVISPYGTRVQLRIDGTPLEVTRNIPEDGITLANTTVSDPTKLLLEAKNFIPKPDTN